MYGVGNSRRQELADYLEKQRQRRAVMDSDPYRASEREDRLAEAESADSGNLAASLADATAAVGTIGGQRADSSSVRRMADASAKTNQNYYGGARADSAARDRQYGIDGELYRHLAEKEQGVEDTAGKREEFKAKLKQDQGKLDAEVKAKKEEGDRRDKLDREKLKLDSDRLEFDKTKENMPGKSNKREFDALSEEKKEGIKKYASSIAERTSIANLLESQIKEFQNADSDDSRVKAGEMMLKTLNSPLGRDSVGTEEANRLGSFLKNKMFNMRGPGSMFGPDFDLFEKQIVGQLGSIRGSVQMDNKGIDQMYGRQPGEHPYALPELRLQGGESGTAQAAPKGKIPVSNGQETLYIDEADLAEAEADGYKTTKVGGASGGF